MNEERIARIEKLVQQVSEIPDVQSRNIAHELMAAVLELHGAALERTLEILFESGESGQSAIRRLAADKLVSSLLVLHGIHPDDMENRVRQVLAKMPGRVELQGIFAGVVRVRVMGEGFIEAVEAALREAVPDATDIVVEQREAVHGFVPLSSIGLAVQP